MTIGQIETNYDNGMEYSGVVLNQTTTFTIKTKEINWGEAGMIMVHAAAIDTSGNAATGAKMVRYKKSTTGALTLGTVTNVLAPQLDTGMTGCNFNMVANANNNIDITVIGTSPAKQIA